MSDPVIWFSDSIQMRRGDWSLSTSRNRVDTQHKGVRETFKRTSGESIDTWREAGVGYLKGNDGKGGTCTKVNRKRKQNVRCQGWIWFAIRRVRMKLIYMWREPWDVGVPWHSLCGNITRRQMNIHVLNRAFLYSFFEHGILALWHRKLASDFNKYLFIIIIIIIIIIIMLWATWQLTQHVDEEVTNWTFSENTRPTKCSSLGPGIMIYNKVITQRNFLAALYKAVMCCISDLYSSFCLQV
jgi:hypothetical protein